MEDGGWRIETRETLWCIHKAPMSGSKRGIPLITSLNILNPFRFTVSRNAENSNQAKSGNRFS